MTEPSKLEPFLPSLESMLAHDELPFPAMLPLALRDELDRTKAVQTRLEEGKRKRERIERLMAEIAGHEAKIEELRKEAVWDYAGIPAPTPAPAA